MKFIKKTFYILLAIFSISCFKKQESKLFITQLPSSCDENVYDLPRDFIKIEKKVVSDSLVDLTFKFVEPCCEEYSGDFKLQNDTLRIQYWQSNEVSCACLCCYNYNFKITGLKSKPQYISISKKRIE